MLYVPSQIVGRGLLWVLVPPPLHRRGVAPARQPIRILEFAGNRSERPGSPHLEHRFSPVLGITSDAPAA
jgi:hypothetical protein